MPWIKHRGGPIGADFSPGWEGRILDEVERYEDPKGDISVTVLHETGWYLSVLPFGSVLLDHLDNGSGGPQMAVLREEDLIDALRAIARGDVAAISILIERAQLGDRNQSFPMGRKVAVFLGHYTAVFTVLVTSARVLVLRGRHG